MRPDWDEYFLAMADVASLRGDCTRRQVGAVMVDTNNMVIITGYNGVAAGQPGCLAGACPRGRLTHDQIPLGSSYDNCIASHAEQNCMIHGDPRRFPGASIYVSSVVCAWCEKMLRSAGLARAVYLDKNTQQKVVVNLAHIA